MDVIAKTIMLPHENPPMRLPTFPNLERTAVCGFETNLQTNSISFGKAVRRYTLHRSASAPFWLDQSVPDTNSARAMYGYCYNACTQAEEQNPLPEFFGTLAPLGEYGGDYWIYFPANFDGVSADTTAMGVHSESDAMTVDYTVMYDNGATENFVSIVTTNVGILPGTAAKACWVRINSYKSNTGLSRLVVFPFAGARALWPAYAPPQANVSLAPYTSCRVTALALLATNVSRVQVKQGTITGARFSSSTPSFFSAVPSMVNGVHPAERYYGAAENGAYIVAPPTQDSEEFIDAIYPGSALQGVTATGVPSYSTNTAVYVPIVKFNSDDPFMALFVAEELVTTEETLIAITVDIHLEFRTSSPLFQVGISTIPLETYHASQLVVAQSGYFYENATHWRELAGKIARLAAQAIPLLFPGTRVARVAAAASMLLGRSTRHDMTQKQMVKPRARSATPRRAPRKAKPRVRVQKRAKTTRRKRR